MSLSSLRQNNVLSQIQTQSRRTYTQFFFSTDTLVVIYCYTELKYRSPGLREFSLLDKTCLYPCPSPWVLRPLFKSKWTSLSKINIMGSVVCPCSRSLIRNTLAHNSHRMTRLRALTSDPHDLLLCKLRMSRISNLN